MDKITSFKEFVKLHPKLLNYVKTGDMTWQKFYEMYDLYGEDNEVWKSYITKEEVESTVGTASLASIVTWLKGINLDKMQEGINSVQRVLGVLEDFSSKDSTNIKPDYQPRPLYKHFED